jgi:hypothetical protein
MATGPIMTERCLLCGRELPRGGFSARVAGLLLSALCVECERRCSREPHNVVAEHPHWFDGSAIIPPHIHPTSSPIPPSPPRDRDHLRVVPQPVPDSNVSGSSLQQVVVTDIHMPFGSMVRFMLKWAIASIPAFIILFLLGMVVLCAFRTISLEMLSMFFTK